MANINAYAITSGVIGKHPNNDMLIIKPGLYVYISNDQIEDIKKNGLKADSNNEIHALFTRIPHNVQRYESYLSDHSAIKIMVSKLKRVKDQKIKIKPFNIPNFNDSIGEDELQDIANKNGFFFKYFQRGDDIKNIPHAIIWLEDGILPPFTFKVIELE